MKTFFTLITTLLSTFALLGQNQIRGTLIDNETKNPVSYASVALLSLPDSTNVKGMISGEDGSFLFASIPRGQYAIKVKYMGYRDGTTGTIDIDGSGGIYEYGNLLLEVETKNLKEVTVTAERLKGVETVDRTVYSIPESAVKTAGSGTDILKRIPAVQVDLSNKVSLEGSSNIIILVDGKERDQNFIAQIDPKMIDKVEVSTNPSSKYDASITGVISIVLKKQKRLGINGNFDLEVPTSNDHFLSSSTAGIDYGYYKFRFFTSVNDHFEGFRVTKDFYRESEFNKYQANGNGRFSFNSPFFHYGFDYFINDKNTFNFYANYNPSVNKMDYLLRKFNYNSDTLTNYFTTDNKNRDDRKGQFYSLFYKKGFNRAGQSLTTDISLYKNSGLSVYNFADQYYKEDGITTDGDLFKRDETLEPTRRSINVKVDYTQTISEKYIVEIGYQNYNQWISNSNNSLERLEPDFKFQEVRNAAYFQLGAKFSKLNLRAGLRAENSSISIGNDAISDYSCWLPNATVQYTMSKSQNLKLNYRKSIKRPGSDDLNPYEIVYDSLNIQRGNPNLKPSYSDKIQLNYSLNLGSNYIGPEVYFRRQTDIFQQVAKLNSNNVMELNIDNLGEGYEYGIGITASLQPTKWLTLNPYVKLCSEHYEGVNDANTFEIPKIDNVAWQGTLYAQAKLPKGFSVWGYTTYNSPGVSLQTRNYRDCLYVLGFEKSILKEKGKIGINWYEMFRDNFRFDRKVTETPGLYKDDDNKVELGTLVSLKFTYKFSYGSEVKKLERQKNLETDGKGGLN